MKTDDQATQATGAGILGMVIVFICLAVLAGCATTKDYRTDQERALGIELTPAVIELRKQNEQIREQHRAEQLRYEMDQYRLNQAYWQCFHDRIAACIGSGL